MKKPKIALLSGGVSGEREVSLKTGEQVYDILKEKYHTYRYDPLYQFREFIDDAFDKKFDLIFPALHGPFGEDGKIQGLFELLDIPYLFSDCLASALAMDKHKTKIIAQKAGIPVVKGQIIESNEELNDVDLPVIIKPVASGSSVGITKVEKNEDLQKGIDNAFRYDSRILIEDYTKGRELTVAIAGRKHIKPLPVLEIIPKNSDWFDYESKYIAGASEEICPADIPEKIKNRIQEYALNIFKDIGCRDLARMDFIWDEKDGEIKLLEANTIPGMTKTSLVPQAVRADGQDFGRFLEGLITEAVSDNSF
jgi:D-alanine-D-alanine ligase